MEGFDYFLLILSGLIFLLWCYTVDKIGILYHTGHIETGPIFNLVWILPLVVLFRVFG